MKHISYQMKETIKSFGKKESGLETGFENLDSTIIGLQPGNLILIGARPSMGKTSMALDIALNVGKKHNVLFVSLEMSFRELQERAACNIARLNCHRIKSGFVDFDQEEQLIKAEKDCQKRNVFVVDGTWKFYPHWYRDRKTNEVPKDDLRRFIIKSVEEYKTELVIIDHLQFIRTEMFKHDNESLRLHEITQTLHELTVELNIPIILLSQLRRLNPEQKLKDPRPSMDDIRNSGQVEENCNIIAILHRPAYYRSKHEIDLFSNKTEDDVELIIEKNRNGPTGKLSMKFLAYCMSFESQVDKDEGIF